jgi:hypothetical protein
MKARAEIPALDDTTQADAACRFWGAGLVVASLASWALILGAARLIATLV